jgi:hypothetical protein
MSMNGSAPRFVPQESPHTDSQIPAPYYFENVGIRLFPLIVDAHYVQAVCDRFLNSILDRDGQSFRIDPIIDIFRKKSLIFLEIIRYPRMGSTVGGHYEQGFATQDELLFAIPVFQRSVSGGIFDIGLFAPYIFVNNEWSMISGREVLGYPKLNASFHLPQSLSEIAPTCVKVLAIDPFGHDSQAEMKPLIEIGTGCEEGEFAVAQSEQVEVPKVHDAPDLDKEELETLWPFGVVDNLFISAKDDSEDYGARLAVKPEIFRRLRANAGRRVRNFALKQFRDAENVHDACYQAIVSFDILVEKFGGAGLLPGDNINLHQYASVNIAQHLGLQNPANLNPFFPIFFKADFVLDNVRNEHVRCGTVVAEPSPPGGGGRGPTQPGGGEHDLDRCLSSLTLLCKRNLQCYRTLACSWADALERVARRM